MTHLEVLKNFTEFDGKSDQTQVVLPRSARFLHSPLKNSFSASSLLPLSHHETCRSKAEPAPFESLDETPNCKATCQIATDG